MPKRIAPEPPLHLNPMDYLGLISDLLGLAKPTATLPDALAGELSVGLETLPFSLVEQILDAVLGLEALQPDLKGTIQLYTLFGTAFTRRWTSNSSWLRRTEIRGLWRCLEVTHGLKSLICASALFSASGYTGVNKLLALWTRLQAEQARGQDDTHSLAWVAAQTLAAVDTRNLTALHETNLLDLLMEAFDAAFITEKSPTSTKSSDQDTRLEFRPDLTQMQQSPLYISSSLLSRLIGKLLQTHSQPAPHVYHLVKISRHLSGSISSSLMKTSDSVDQQQLWAVLKTYLFSGVMILTALSRSIELNVVSAQVLQPVHFVALQFGPEGFPSYASLLDQLSFDTSVLDSLAPGSLDNSQVEKGQLIFRWSVARRLAPAVDAHQVTQLLLDVKPALQASRDVRQHAQGLVHSLLREGKADDFASWYHSFVLEDHDWTLDEVQNAYAILLRRADQIGPNQAWLFLNQLSHLAQDLETSELKIQLIKVLCTMLFEVSFSLYQPLLKEAQQLCAGHQELNEHLRSQVSRSRECIDRAQIATLWLMDGELPEQQCSQL